MIVVTVKYITLFLCIDNHGEGGEALYADMRHFAIKPIRFAGYGCVLPALILNYPKQYGFLIATRLAISNPFF